MSRFSDAIEEFLEEYDMVYAEITMQVRRRELYRLCHVVDDLFARGMISTDDPSSMQVNDVKVIAAILKRDGGMSVNTRTHMLGRLGLLCRFKGNQVVDSAKVRYPSLFPAKVETRLGVLTGEEVRILRRTWGQMLEDMGVPESDVSVLLGHASTATTARYYARVSERRAIENVRRTWAEMGSIVARAEADGEENESRRERSNEGCEG